MPTNSSKASGRMAVWSFDRQPAVKRARVPRTLLTYGPPILPCQAEPTAFGPGFAQARVRVWQVAPMVGKESVFIGRRQETGQLSVKCLVSLRLSLKGNKGVLEKQGAGLQEKKTSVPRGWYHGIHFSAFGLPSYHPRKRRAKNTGLRRALP